MAIVVARAVALLVMLYGCVEPSAKTAEFTGESFTLQLHNADKESDKNNGDGKVRLLLCQEKNCKNPLRKAGGKEEYLFDDHYAVYSKGQQTSKTGKRLRTALLWGSLLAGLSSVWFYIKSDKTRKVLAAKYEELQELMAVKKVHKMNDEVARLESKESFNTNAFYASEIAIVSTALTSIVTSNVVSDGDALKQKLTNLLLHKQPVHVNRDELRRMLVSLTELVPAVIDQTIKAGVMKT
ncbi:MAG: hypothetical protein OYH77_07310 [Pseudomonadota bacterium]|nr:hypothetical protein [Pseudomonadota bacterium]